VNNRATLRAALSNSNFRALWLGLLVSQVGDSFMLIATLEVIQRLTNSSIALGAMGVSIGLPMVVFGLVAGVFVDRLDRRVAMIVADVIRGLVVLILLTVDAPGEIWVFFVVGFIMGSMGIFFAPARNAVLPNIVGPDLLLPANTLVQGTQIISMALGPTLAGLVIGLFGTSFAFTFNAMTFFASAVAISTIDITHKRADYEDVSFDVVWAQLKEGLNFIRRRRVITNISITAGVAMLGLGSIVVLGVQYLNQELGVGATGFGFLVSVLGIGMVVGGILIGNYSSRLETSVVVGGGMGMLGLSLVGFALAPDYGLVLVLAFVIGACMVAARAAIAALLQAMVPDDKRGRVESAVNTIISASTTLSMGLAGFFGEVLGIRLVFGLAGGVTVLAAGMAYHTLRETEVEARAWQAAEEENDQAHESDITDEADSGSAP
jgi:predicted MFS family arabinose efflux permease